MKLVVTSALWAAVIVGLPVFLMMSTSRFPAQWQWLVNDAGLIIVPAFYMLIAVGRKGGPDGMPSALDAIVLTFLMLWGAIYVGRAAWRRFCA